MNRAFPGPSFAGVHAPPSQRACRHPAEPRGRGACTPSGFHLPAPSARRRENATVIGPARPRGLEQNQGETSMSITTTPVANDTTTPADDGAGQAPITSHYAMPGVPWLAVDVNSGITEGVDGTLTVGPVAIPVQLTPPTN